ncbi:MAG: HTH domain-containing protein, partial [Robiginitomaculum sp.]|nr:HTH domain-containing protein [Robiginitomaculum sp.]
MTDETQKLGPTRRAILEILKQSGNSTATALADKIGVTAMAVRQHLYALQDQKLIIAKSVSLGRGRPTKNWHLSPSADKIFPDAHQGLAVELLDHVRQAFGENGLSQIIDKHTDRQIETYQMALSGITKLCDRIQALAKIRTNEGYM